MPIHNHVPAIASTLAIAALAACSGGGASSAPDANQSIVAAQAMGSISIPALARFQQHASTTSSARRPSWMRVHDEMSPEAEAPDVYVGQVFSIIAYTRKNRNNGGPTCTIGNLQGVQGIGVDAEQNIWVPESNNGSPIVQEFAPNCGAPETTLIDPAGDPFGIAFDSKGTAYVANVKDFGNLPGDIQVYAGGSTVPTAVLSDPAIVGIFADAVDARDNVYATFVRQDNTYGVIEFPAGTMPGTVLNLSGLSEPFSLAFDNKGNLTVDDTFSPTAINVYTPPYNGGPARSIPLKGSSPFCTLGQHAKRIFCANNAYLSLDVYDYQKGDYLYSYTNGLIDSVSGLATSPAAPN